MATTRVLKATVLVAALALFLLACSSSEETGPPSCTHLGDATHDPCEGVLRGYTGEGGVQVLSGGRDPGDEPRPIRGWLDGGTGVLLEAHIVIRGQYLPETIRCDTINEDRGQPYSTLAGVDRLETGLGAVMCYGDIQVAEYIVGSGPNVLTSLHAEVWYWDSGMTETEVAAARKEAEDNLIRHVPGVEAILFLGPAANAAVEAWQTFAWWDLERREDGTVIAVHPDRDYWQRQENYESMYRSKVEMTLPAFRAAATADHNSRIADYGGRIDNDREGLPQVITSANNLRAFHVETGNAAHADGPPAPPPPPCGLAVPNQAQNPGLMLDCMALLEARDALRGTGTLNWSVETAIGSWDGVTVEGTPQRVTKLELANKSLTGTVPAALARLELTTLKLARNSLTGCIPPSLREVAVNDLDDLGLPDCAG